MSTVEQLKKMHFVVLSNWQLMAEGIIVAPGIAPLKLVCDESAKGKPRGSRKSQDSGVVYKVQGAISTVGLAKKIRVLQRFLTACFFRHKGLLTKKGTGNQSSFSVRKGGGVFIHNLIRDPRIFGLGPSSASPNPRRRKKKGVFYQFSGQWSDKSVMLQRVCDDRSFRLLSGNVYFRPFFEGSSQNEGKTSKTKIVPLGSGT
ncbi:hypothetical protein NPIL_289861 [Nephila pilipes]|uniref:Uncharacterized protein n=1 Tax=Nephila pilipes TaxID=299642 RepID=A0A8X6U953_NEPPI|nr:hypothetical protein NPIL_289861 [Nephila pilipes]